MDTKFKAISRYLENLEKENVINEEEQSILLVGGEGTVGKTNILCNNDGCTNDPCYINYNCNNWFCDNPHCQNSGCTSSSGVVL